MVQAKSGNVVLADSSATVALEGNHYFPPSALKMDFFKPSAKGTKTTCGFKGVASYYDVHVDGKVISDAAWYYPDAKSGAKNIENHVAFYKSKVQVA